tara:strand:+ start:16753 stop:17877 length:1125 start_codon:yes stop_codon:yes gene_type:complete
MPKPKGNNKLSSYAIFTQRKFYKEEVFGDNLPTPIDLWYEKPFYGRVDTNNIPVYPIESKLKAIDSATGNVFVLDFVADAFKDFRENFLILNENEGDSAVFESLRPVLGWNNPLEERQEFLKQVYNVFVGDYLPNKKRSENIVSFGTFLTQFLNFMEEANKEIPVTLTNYILSGLPDQRMTGLIISVALDDHSNDLTKYDDFIQDDAFPCYAATAEKFGFKVDKNAPWRLIADLKSPVMEAYMGDNNSFNNVFDVYYEKSYYSDIQLIKEICERFYYSYISDFPAFTKHTYSEKNLRTETEVIVRERISKRMIARDFPETFWVSYYIDILLRETGIKLTDAQLNTTKARASRLMERGGPFRAREFVFQTFLQHP